MSKKLKHEEYEDTINGRKVTRSKTYSIKTTSDEFFMTFLGNMKSLFAIKSSKDLAVMAKLNSMAQYNTGRVGITQEDRIAILSELGMDASNLSRSLKSLKELGLISGDRGVYDINPLVFWKGTTDDRKKLLTEQGMEIKIKFLPADEEAESNPMKTGSKQF